MTLSSCFKQRLLWLVLLTSSSCAVNPPSTSGPLSLRVQGRHFIDAAGEIVQLRGVNYSGFEFVAIQGWHPADPSGAQAGQARGPNWKAIKAWKANTIRIPLNEASWLGTPCTDTDGVVRRPDPAGNYRAAVKSQVAEASAAGLYVIVDLHWSAPGDSCPMLQMQMANRDHSLKFWNSVAETFKHNPAVLFELFNEPFFNFGFEGDAWPHMMKGSGGRFTSYPATSGTGNWQDIKRPWVVASYQEMLDVVRATGARNVVLIGGVQYAQDLSGWLAHRPTDPLQQMAAVWHPYPTFGKDWGSAAYAQPNEAPRVYCEVRRILAAGFPVIATETGDRNLPGTIGAPLLNNVTAFADEHGLSVLGWGWNVWGEPDNVLIKDASGTPTDGYGQAFQQWLGARSAAR